MNVTGWHLLYLLWLSAGAMDFMLHRASNIEATSGLKESTLHLVQIGILGLATVLWLGFQASPTLLAILLALVCLHAITGYWDTKVAYPKRAIRPVEQHVHSILDLAPLDCGRRRFLVHPGQPGRGWFDLRASPATHVGVCHRAGVAPYRAPCPD